MILLLLIYLTFIIIGLPNAMFGVAWPTMYSTFGSSLSAAGFISLIITGFTVVAALASDWLVHKIGVGKLTCLSLFLIAAGLTGFTLSDTFVSLILWTMPLGMGMGFIDTTLNNVVAVKYKAIHMSWLHGFWAVGAFLGPVIMSFSLSETTSWVAGYRGVAIAAIVTLCLLGVTIKQWQSASDSGTEVAQTTTAVKSKAALLNIPGVKPSLLVFFFYTAIEATVALWIASYLVSARSISVETAALWTSLYFFGLMAGRFLSGLLTLVLSNRQMITLGVTLIGCGVLLFILPLPHSILLVALFLIGFGCAPIYPSMIHETPRNFGTTDSQGIIGLQSAFAFTGATIMPPIFGLIARFTSFHWLPLYVAVLLAALAGAKYMLVKGVKQ